MTRANVARRHGDDFQARLFWLKAASLLDSNSNIVKISYETGPRGFDDISVTYDTENPRRDHKGNPFHLEHIQCKWHTRGGVFGYEDLIDPTFVNATRHSLLQRAYHAQLKIGSENTQFRLMLITNWRIDHKNPLSEIVRSESNAIDLDCLFDGKTERSCMGRVRKAWREHLSIDSAALKILAGRLVLAECPQTSLEDLRERLNERFSAVGMKQVPNSESCFLYDDLFFKLQAQTRLEFDRNSFAEMAFAEGLLDTQNQPTDVLTIGVRSFMHPIDSLQDRCTCMHDMVHYFNGRYIKNEDDWQGKIHPELEEFLITCARGKGMLRLILDTHASLAFAAGSVLNVKSGKNIEIEQRSGGRQFWSMNDSSPDPDWPILNVEEEVINNNCDEIALAVGLTHDVANEMKIYARKYLPKIGRILHYRPETGHSQRSVSCGCHAWQIAEHIAQSLHSIRGQRTCSTKTHVFFAGPNSVLFFLGQQQQMIGSVSLYEWDFEHQRGGTYKQSFVVGL